MKDNKSQPPESGESPKAKKRNPWWLSVLLAIISYCSLKYVIPAIPFTNLFMQKLALAAPTFAPLITIPFLLLAAKQLYDGDTGNNNNKEDDMPEDEPDESARP